MGAGCAGILPSRELPSTIPIIRLGRGGGDPKSLNVAAWGAASSPQPLRGRVLRGKADDRDKGRPNSFGAPQEGNLSEDRLLRWL